MLQNKTRAVLIQHHPKNYLIPG